MKAFSEYITEKKIRVFDFDDTLVRTDGVIRVTTRNGLVKELSPAKYAVYDPKPGDQFDYSDFEKVLNPRPVKLFDYILQQVRRKGSKAEVLTARGNYGPIKAYLASRGIRGVFVNALGSADPNDKAKHIEQLIRQGYTHIEFFDDSPKNIAAVKQLKDKYPDIYLRARLVK